MEIGLCEWLPIEFRIDWLWCVLVKKNYSLAVLISSIFCSIYVINQSQFVMPIQVYNLIIIILPHVQTSLALFPEANTKKNAKLKIVYKIWIEDFCW